jgi:uncharacterized protein (TIGR01244 family)
MWKALIVMTFLSGLGAMASDMDYIGRTADLGQWRIGGQPAEHDFQAIREAGITTVINNRLPQELDPLPFDEPQAASKAGLQYLHLPVGDEGHPYSPALLDAFADGLQAAPGPVLIHCRSGRRSRTLLAAFLVRQQGVAVGEALETVGAQGIDIEDVNALLAQPSKADDSQ